MLVSRCGAEGVSVIFQQNSGQMSADSIKYVLSKIFSIFMEDKI